MAEVLAGGRVQPPGRRPEIAAARSLAIIATLAIITALYFAKAILLPLALAVLLTFVLAPPVRLLRGFGLGQVPSVAIVVVCAFLAIVAMGSYLGQQVSDLAEKLPQYQSVVQQKIQAVINATSGGTLERLSGFLDRVNQELTRKEQSPSPGASPESQPAVPPVQVEISQPAPSPIQFLQQVLPSLLGPLATIGMVTVFVIFFLLQRGDLRDRLIRLAGSHDLKRTTAALDDAAHRLSRYFLAQTALNAVFGVVVAIGLGLIGVPNPILWGISGMLLRFVPYIGAIISAAFPIALAVAVGPDWSMALWTVGLFIVVEPLIGQVLEPLVYGHSTGLSPVAVIIAATFWTWLWGPVGLLLSTPITVCLSVLGRHIEWLDFLDVLIGGDAPLSAAQTFYQRALAGDSDEVVEQAERMLKHRPLLDYYDGIVLSGLFLAAIDLRRGLLGRDDVERINEVAGVLIEELADHDDGSAAEAKAVEPMAGSEPSAGAATLPGTPARVESDASPGPRDATPIACVAGRGAFDETIVAILVQLLEKRGFGAESCDLSAPKIGQSAAGSVEIACLASLDVEGSATHARNLLRRMRRHFPHATIVVGMWGHDAGESPAAYARAGTGSERYASSLSEGLGYLLEAARVEAGPKGAINVEADASENRRQAPAASSA